MFSGFNITCASRRLHIMANDAGAHLSCDEEFEIDGYEPLISKNE